MCGIAGLQKSIITESEISSVDQMCKRMQHRGPDHQGIWHDEHVCFGHRRLSIIDLSVAANQPMLSHDKRFVITFNGEIYNFLELKSELEKNGVTFRTKSDTELIIEAYRFWGKNCLHKFNGMFAFAIWDTVEKKMFVARDRFGKKPFFYTQIDNGFCFASEIHALLQYSEVKRKISLAAFNCFLSIGYILNPQTIFEDIYQLQPAHYMVIDVSGKIIENQQYWNYADTFRNKTNDSNSTIKDNLVQLLKQSVQRRMISDVPVGAFLSGGVDSSTIVALMKAFHKGDLHTFSVGFNQKSYNELPDAERVAAFAKTIHHSHYCDPENPLTALEGYVDVFDQPFADNSLIPMIEVSHLARKFVTVVLSGDGADELFAGYITYKADKYYQFAKYIPMFLKKYLGKEKKINSSQKIGFQYKIQQFFNGCKHDYKKAHYLWRSYFGVENRIQILGNEHKEMVYDTDPFKQFDKYYGEVKDLSHFDQHFFVDGMTWLPDDILTKVDRTTMYASIEARAPFLDIDFVNYANSIPHTLKLKHLKTKYILKEAIRGIVPDYVLEKKKSGFNAPVNSWIKGEYANEFQNFNKFVYDRFNNQYESR